MPETVKISEKIENFIRNNYYYEDGYVFSNSLKCNRRGKPLGWLNGAGHLQVTIRFNNKERKNILVQHIVWFLCTGYWPERITHIDYNLKNNHIENLKNA